MTPQHANRMAAAAAGTAASLLLPRGDNHDDSQSYEGSSAIDSSSDSSSDSSYSPGHLSDSCAAEIVVLSNTPTKKAELSCAKSSLLAAPNPEDAAEEFQDLAQSSFHPSQQDIRMEPSDFLDDRVVGDGNVLDPDAVLSMNEGLSRSISEPPYDLMNPSSPVLEPSPRPPSPIAASPSPTTSGLSSAAALVASGPGLTSSRVLALATSSPSEPPPAGDQPQRVSPLAQATAKETQPPAVASLAVASKAPQLSAKWDDEAASSVHQYKIHDSSGHVLVQASPLTKADEAAAESLEVLPDKGEQSVSTMSKLITPPPECKNGSIDKAGWIPPAEPSPVQITYVSHDGVCVVFKEPEASSKGT